MAGGGEEGGHEPKKRGRAAKRKKTRRMGIRLDMTPLVDIAFLLLTFFMFSTSMSRPQTMELNLPPDDEATVEVGESNLLTLRVDKEGVIFASIGIESPKRVEFSDLRRYLKEQAAAKPKLVTLLKVDREGSFSLMVNMIDEFNLASVTRFSLAPMEDRDKALVEKAKQL